MKSKSNDIAEELKNMAVRSSQRYYGKEVCVSYDGKEYFIDVSEVSEAEKMGAKRKTFVIF